MAEERTLWRAAARAEDEETAYISAGVSAGAGARGEIPK